MLCHSWRNTRKKCAETHLIPWFFACSGPIAPTRLDWLDRCSNGHEGHTLVPDQPNNPSSRRGSGHFARRRHSTLIALAAIAVVVAVVWGAAALRRSPVDTALAISTAQDDAALNTDLDQDALTQAGAQRPVYKYSVIPGGAYDDEELQRALADPVVAAHYANLDRAHVRTEIVPADRYVHVSYRKGDRILWTSKKVLLRAGERILTDGKTQIRSRCGNCISEAPLGPTETDEPDLVEFDRLLDSTEPANSPLTDRVSGLAPLSAAGGSDNDASGAAAGTPGGGV